MEEVKDYTIRWNKGGDLMIEFEDELMLRVNFYQSFHGSELPQMEKLEMLRQIVERALNNPDMNEVR